jgi:hypothetical protein
MENRGDNIQIQNTGEKWEEGSPQIELSQICFVRALKDTSQIKITDVGSGDEAYLPNLNELTKGEYDRSTVHWSINHKVSSHLYGSWFDSKVVVIAPAEGMIKRNDIPENLNAVDTFWAKGLFLPQESKILLIGKNKKFNDKSIKGVQIVKSQITEGELANLKALEKTTNNDPINFQKEDDYFSAGKEIDNKICSEVNKLIDEMGYTVLDQDHGTYMGEENLDEDISLLSDKYGIKHSTLHTYTLFGNFEDHLGNGLLETVSQFTFPEDSSSDETDFSNLIDGVTSIFDDFKIETKGEKEQILRFTAELYMAIMKYPKITEVDCNLYALVKLSESQPEILENLEKWSISDKINGKVATERINKIKETVESEAQTQTEP